MLDAGSLWMILCMRSIEDVMICRESPASMTILKDDKLLYRIYTKKLFYEEYEHHAGIRQVLYEYHYDTGHTRDSRPPDPHDLLAEYDALFKKKTPMEEFEPVLPDVRRSQEQLSDLDNFRRVMRNIGGRY